MFEPAQPYQFCLVAWSTCPTFSVKNIHKITVAPDTHVCKATLKLGVITEEEFNSNDVQLIVAEKWEKLLEKTKYKPIDIHTQLWLWSRNGFREIAN